MKFMKMTAVATAILALCSQNAFAKKDLPLSAESKNDRCGVGTMIWKGNQAISSQYSEQSTNNSLSNTISVTFNAFGCKSEGFVKHTQEELIYANANFEELKVELAQGQGEAVAGLSYTIGCESSHDMANVLKSNYANLVEGNPTPDQMLSRIKTSLAGQSSACNLVM